MNGDRSSTDRVSAPERSGVGQAKVVAVDTLLAGEREVVLLHNGERYRLRITQNGKLILTK